MTSVEQQRLPILGVNNESGVIVGFGLLSDPPVFYAYDAQCPNCYENDSRPRYLLSMTSDGKAKCSRCGRTYDMNNSGIIIDGGPGEKLYRYHAIKQCRNGGIGRHEGLKIPWPVMAVRVRVPLAAPSNLCLLCAKI